MRVLKKQLQLWFDPSLDLVIVPLIECDDHRVLPFWESGRKARPVFVVRLGVTGWRNSPMRP
jgi:hypothetical protein